MVNILLSWYNFADGYLKDELLKYCKPSDKVAIISFAHRDDADEAAYDLRYGKNGKHFVYPANEFRKLGIPGGNICLVHYYEDSADEMRAKMEQADIWMLTGGMPDRAVARICEKGLAEAFATSGKVVMGVSAGALMQLGDYFPTPMRTTRSWCLRKAWG